MMRKFILGIMAALVMMAGTGYVSAEITVEKLTQLTTDPAKDWAPTWSPDGEEIIFTYSDWVSFVGNPETSSDFIVDTTPTSPNIIQNGDFEIIDPSDSSNPDGWTLEIGGRDPPGWGLYKDVVDDYYYSGSHSVHFRLLGYSHLNCWGIIISPLIDNTQGDLVWYQSQATSFDSSDIEYTIKFYDENDNLISSNLYYTDTTTSQAGPGCGGGTGDSDMSPPAVIAENGGPACGGGNWYKFSSSIPDIGMGKFRFEIHIYQWEAPNKTGDGDACGSACYVGFDNFYIETVTDEEKTDLAITDIWWDKENPKIGDEVTFSYTIENRGAAGTSTEFNNILYIDGERWDLSARGSLAAGESKDRFFTHTWTATAGDHTIEVVADGFGEIDEGDETYPLQKVG